MDNIEVMPEPSHGGWIVLCNCGCREIALDLTSPWVDFDVVQLPGLSCRITCLSCGTSCELKVKAEKKSKANSA